jgi:DNA-binding transcriptional LysR family regulator
MATLRQLEAFRAVMRSGSVTEAGKLLRLTQPTISKLIAQLERSAGLKLFVRANGRLIPRPEAETLLHQVDKVFVAVEELGRNTKRLANGHSGHLRLVAFPPLALRFLPTAIASFRLRHPDVRITLNIRGSSYIPDWIASQQADLGFTSFASPVAGISISPFLSSPAVCILPKSHPLTAKRVISPKDLEGQDYVALGRETPLAHLLDRNLADAGVKRSIAVEAGYSSMACALVAGGQGLSIIDPWSAYDQYQIGGVALRRFAPEVRCDARAAYPSQTGLSLLAQAFLKHIEGQKKEHEEGLAKALQERARA